MRAAILVMGSGRRVVGPAMRVDHAAVELGDRIANGQSFPGECVVRLPRRISRRLGTGGLSYSWGFVTQAIRGHA